MSHRGNGFFQHGLKKIGGVGAGLLDFRFQRLAGGHQGFDPFYDFFLFGEGWEGDRKVSNIWQI